jgi:hypothetical protein
MKYPTSRLTPFPPTFATKIVCKRIENAKNYARAPAIPLSTFRINTCKSVSKQRTLSPSRMNTYKKQGEGAPPRQLSWSVPAAAESVGPSSLLTVDCRPFQSLVYPKQPWGPSVYPGKAKGALSSLLTVDFQLPTVDLLNPRCSSAERRLTLR